ncbi:lipoate--protein ligase family protein [Peribacillus cavernae]|uniref:Octanoyltransferase LipM n=1 Tax=Peribacillus cavernae TaxID=1674310 RepID=A0A3S0U030_9BACI|nr:biotin/lipoate A/B protein ligase family protein [Peribacillus cavernae]MDQ0218345.1 lipoate-protein ligase A [Peribacillus cavernae]RUQ28376.1 lipoate--protein ligase family protein [Peribacillus cavernae]
MKKEVWAYIDSGNCSPSFNMAMDEALLNWHSNGRIPPIIRFYGWDPATLSIGYFQKAEKEINLEEVKKQGAGFVRRPTGGRAVLHEHELTYSVIVNEEYPNMPKNVTEAYRVISEGILRGFKNLGLDAYFAVPKTDNEKAALREPRSSVCFDAPSWYELVVEGRKVAGSAQTRQKGVILQHGSILLDLDEDKLFSMFNFPNDRVKERMMRSFRAKAVAIHDLTSRKIDIPQATEAFKKGFAEGLDIELQLYTLSDKQLVEINHLAKSKYESDEWNFMR